MISIRKAQKNDSHFLLSMICALAAFEKEPRAVTLTLDQLEKDGFDDQPLFECLVLEYNDMSVGFALYYNRYSSWKGKTLYLEDLFVQPEYRGKGLGLAAMKHLIQLAKSTNCQRFEWQVLDWNQPAIDFYKSLGAEIMPEWLSCRIDKQGLYLC